MFDKIKNMFKKEKEIPSIEDANKALDSIEINFNRFLSNDWYMYINCDELKNKILECLHTYDNIFDINLNISIKVSYWVYPIKCIDVYIICNWINGPFESKINDDLKSIINKHLYLIKMDNNHHLTYTLICNRKYSDETILKCAKKYAKCIDKCLPLNMVTVKIMEYNKISVYDMVIRELNMIEDVESYINGEEK